MGLVVALGLIVCLAMGAGPGEVVAPDWSDEPVVTLGTGSPGEPVGVQPLYRSPVPALSAGPEGAWDDRTAQAPSIIWNPDLGLYQMWYDGRTHASGLAAVGYATSEDGEVWTKHEGNPVVPADARWPCVLYEPEDEDAPYKMWFNTGQGVAIIYARSSDGITWTDLETVLERGPAGAYDDKDVRAPRVVKVRNEYRMYYTAATRAIGFPTASFGHFIALATSTDGVQWTKRQTVLSRGAPDEWDSTRVFCPAILHSNGILEMWYVGGNGDPQIGTRNIGYARSSDGVRWTKSARNPVILGTQEAGGYDYGVTAPGVLKVDAAHKVWFTSLAQRGFKMSGVQVGYAEYPLDAWGPIRPNLAAQRAAALARYTCAAAWGMSDEERVRALVPASPEAMPKRILIGPEYATFFAYSAPGHEDWTMTWDPAENGSRLTWELNAVRPGPGPTILYGQWDHGRIGEKRFVFGTITDTRTGITLHDDAYSRYTSQPLRLNPESTASLTTTAAPSQARPEPPQPPSAPLVAAKTYFGNLREGHVSAARQLAVFEDSAAQEAWERQAGDYTKRLKAGGRKWWGDPFKVQRIPGPAPGEWAVAEVQWRYRSGLGWMMGDHYTYKMRTVGGRWKIVVDSATLARGIPVVPSD